MSTSTLAYLAFHRLNPERGDSPSCRQEGIATPAFRCQKRSTPGTEGKIYNSKGHYYRPLTVKVGSCPEVLRQVLALETPWGSAILA